MLKFKFCNPFFVVLLFILSPWIVPKIWNVLFKMGRKQQIGLFVSLPLKYRTINSLFFFWFFQLQANHFRFDDFFKYFRYSKVYVQLNAFLITNTSALNAFIYREISCLLYNMYRETHGNRTVIICANYTISSRYCAEHVRNTEKS